MHQMLSIGTVQEFCFDTVYWHVALCTAIYHIDSVFNQYKPIPYSGKNCYRNDSFSVSNIHEVRHDRIQKK